MKRVLSSILILLIGISAIAQNNKYSVGRLSGTVNVGELGNAVFSLPIEIPEGTNGLSPSVSLNYNSLSGNGILGVGFMLDGFSAITRTNKTIFFDGVASGIDFNHGEDFLLDGKRLIKVSTNKYTLEGDMTAEINYYPDERYFEMKKDGKIFYYGYGMSSNIDIIWQKPAVWNLTKVEDQFGNFMLYDYHQSVFVTMPKSIVYTNNDFSYICEIKFEYEQRSDIVKGNFFGHPQELKERIKDIVIRCYNKDIYIYHLTYTDGDGYSRLSAITKTNTEGESLPPVKFNWIGIHNVLDDIETDILNFSASDISSPVDFYEQMVITGDITADGLDDIILVSPQKVGNGTYFINKVIFYETELKNGGFVFAYKGEDFIESETLFDELKKGNSFAFGDFDGNGTNELIIPFLNVAEGLWKQIGFRFYENARLSDFPWYNLYCSEMPALAFADFKGNGKTQIFYVEKKKNEYGRYNAKLVSLDGDSDFEFYLSHEPKDMFAADFNGDNAVDVIIFSKKGYTILYNDGDGYFTDNNKTDIDGIINGYYIIRMGDFNGDGLPDFVCTETDDKNWYFLLNTGLGGFEKTIAITTDFYDRSFTEHDNGRFDLQILDFDLDGKSDIVSTRGQYYEDDDMWSSPWGVYDYTQTLWLKSDGKKLTEWKKTTSHNESDAYASNFAVGDFNGDGIRELINYGNNCLYHPTNEDNPKWHIYFNSNYKAFCDKLTSVSDIYSTTKFNYTFLTDKSFYQKGSECEYPMLDVVAPLAVVSSTEETNGITDNIIKNYKYYNLTANVQGKGLLGFDKIICQNQYTSETTTTEINSWDTDYYTPKKITQTIRHDTLVTTTETEYSITDLGGKNFFTYPSKIKNTDIYGDVVVSQNTYNTEHGYLESTETYYPDGYCKLQYYGDYVEAGGMWQPQLSTYIQKTPDDPEGFITKKHFEYDANTGTLTKQTDNYGTSKQVATEYKYDEFGNVIHTDIYGDGTEIITTDYTYENQRLVTATKNNPKSVIKYGYDGFGRLITETDMSNQNNPLITTYKYDNWGNLIKTQYPDGTITTTEKGWGKSNEQFYFILSQQTAAPWQKQWYDILGRKTLTETVGEGGVEIKDHNIYDKFSNIINTKTLYGDTEFNESYVYDNQNRIIEHTGTKGAVTKYTYTKNSVTTETDGRKTLKKYDVFGNLLSIDDGIATITYTYNSDCKPVAINAAGAEYRLEYDEVGNRILLSDPDAGVSKYEYDVWGNIVKQTDAEGNITENNYHNGLLTESVSGGENTLYIYDDYGKLIKKQFGDIATEYEYDNLNRVKSETYTIEEREYVYHFAYNKDGLLESKSFPDGTTEYYRYDDLGNLTEILLDDTSVWKLKTTSLFERTAEINGQYTKTQLCDKFGFPISTAMSYEGAVLKEMTYKFNTKTGNLMSRSGMFPEPESFEYDQADRLTKITNGQSVTDIDYSENGNILFKTGLGNYEYFRKRPHALESVDNTDTLIVNPLQEIDYTPFNKTKSISIQYSDESETSISFKYDADHIRRKSVRNVLGVEITQYFLPDYEELGGYGIYQKTHYINSPDGLVGVYVIDPLGGKKLETVFTDHLGSITTLYQEATPTFEASYDAFGNRTITTGTTAFTRGYCGVHQHYPSFDIIDMGGRMYDPIVGRFLSPDPFVQDWENSQNFNRYSYCLNNPLKYTDPSGEFFIKTIFTFVVDFFVKGFCEGGFDITSSSARHNAWRKFDPTASWSKTNKAFKIDKGFFRTDPNKNGVQRTFQLFSRFILETPQSLIGKDISHFRNLCYDVDVDYYNGVTLVNRYKKDTHHAFTLGSYINSVNVKIGSDNMFYHEFGHTIQSRLLGSAYFPLVAIPSLFGAQISRWGWHNHKYEWYETAANKHSHHYLNKYDKQAFNTINDINTGFNGWNEDKYPLNFHFDWFWLFAHP